MNAHAYQNQQHPYRPVWDAIEAHVRGRGLIHGMQAFEILSVRFYGKRAVFPSDAADILRAMVEVGILRPVAKDLAGAGISIRAFRGLQYSPRTDSKPAPYPDPDAWLNSFPSEAADGYLWTFEIGCKDRATS